MVCEILKLYVKSKMRNADRLKYIFFSFLLFPFILVLFYKTDMVKTSFDLIYNLEYSAIFVIYLIFDLIIKLVLKPSFYFDFKYLLFYPLKKASLFFSYFLVELINIWTIYPLFFVVLFLFNYPNDKALCLSYLMLFISIGNTFVLETTRMINLMTKKNIISLIVLFMYTVCFYICIFFCKYNLIILLLILVLICVLVIVAFAIVLKRMKYLYDSNYTSLFLLKIKCISFLKLEFIYIIRCKRIRQLFVVSQLWLLFAVYKLFFFSGEVNYYSSVILLFLYIQSPCFILGQYIGAIEGNFSSVLLTKPVSIYSVLKNKYYFYNLLSSLNLFLSIPLVLFGRVELITLLFLWIYVIGLNVMIIFVFAIPKNKLDLNSSILFNSQGFSLAPFLYIITFICLEIIFYIFSNSLLILLVGLFLILVSRYIILIIQYVYYKNRYNVFK